MEENTTVRVGWWRRGLRIVNSLVWVIVALIVIPQACGTYWTDRARTKLLDQFQSERKSRVIAMIHRQETVSVLGVPVSNFIDIEDSEEILRAIRATPRRSAHRFDPSYSGRTGARGGANCQSVGGAQGKNHRVRAALRDERRHVDRLGCR